MKLHGVVPPIGTPLTPMTGSMWRDCGGWPRFCWRVVCRRFSPTARWAVSPFSRTISRSDRWQTTVEAVDRKIPVIGGLGETSTARAVALAKRIEAAGVDAISMLPPYYYFATQDHLIAYFSEIAAAVDLPLFLYDNPVMTKNHIRPETVARLRSQIPRISGIKVSNQDLYESTDANRINA